MTRRNICFTEAGDLKLDGCAKLLGNTLSATVETAVAVLKAILDEGAKGSVTIEVDGTRTKLIW